MSGFLLRVPSAALFTAAGALWAMAHPWAAATAYSLAWLVVL